MSMQVSEIDIWDTMDGRIELDFNDKALSCIRKPDMQKLCQAYDLLISAMS